MASPLRVFEQPTAAELDARAKNRVLELVRGSARPLPPRDLFATVSSELRVPFEVVQVAMWDLVANGRIEFTDDYTLRLAQ
jgi:hypothetical protein